VFFNSATPSNASRENRVSAYSAPATGLPWVCPGKQTSLAARPSLCRVVDAADLVQ
jgi:hypothetical protein